MAKLYRVCMYEIEDAKTNAQRLVEMVEFTAEGEPATVFDACDMVRERAKVASEEASPLIRRDVDWYEDVTTSEYDNAIEHPLPFLEDVLWHISTCAAFPNREAYYDARECVNEAIQSLMAVDAQCECGDPGCPVHEGVAHCRNSATYTVYRVDMQDETGTSMCDKCAEDALDSGVFITRED